MNLHGLHTLKQSNPQMDSVKIETIFRQHTKAIQLALKLLILVVFLGYIMIWIMMPTNTFWLHWLPDINAKADSIYLGEQGTNILIYSFPIVLIATLGCIYLHLDKYVDDRNDRIPKDLNSGSMTQPVLITGPIGIVSWTELCFLLMFITLLIWSFSAYVYGMFKNITTQSSSKMGYHVWEVRLDSVALLLGLVGNICLSFLFYPVTRGSSILRLIRLTSESSVKYHIWLGHMVLTIFLAHGLCYVVFWANTHQISEMMKWSKDGVSNVAGEVALLSGTVIWITSLSAIRRKLFELFFYTHHLYIVFIVFFVLHIGFSYSCIMLPGFYLFLIDRYLRFLQSQKNVCLMSARMLPCQAIELNFRKDPRLSYNPSSIIFINVKSLSKLQWHPFTITSNNKMDPHHLSIVIKSEGNWSQKLYESLSSPEPLDRLQVSIEGPYAPPTPSFLRHDMLVLVSGGSGITPFISIIRELIVITNMKGKAPRVVLVSAFKKSQDLTMLSLLIPFGSSHDISRLNLQIQAYITRDTNSSTASQNLPKTIWLKSSVTDTSVSTVLGSSSWLWLGGIISSSFAIFLLLLSLLNRYCIYPINANTNTIYSHAARSMIKALILCVSILMVATLSFIRNKKQIQSAEAGSWMQEEVEREVESFPQQSFEQATTVHYGQRPNMRKILREYEGSKVGVFVSGPEKMRQDVAAAVCSSDSAKTMHFQSLSFTW